MVVDDLSVSQYEELRKEAADYYETVISSPFYSSYPNDKELIMNSYIAGRIAKMEAV